MRNPSTWFQLDILGDAPKEPAPHRVGSFFSGRPQRGVRLAREIAQLRGLTSTPPRTISADESKPRSPSALRSVAQVCEGALAASPALRYPGVMAAQRPAYVIAAILGAFLLGGWILHEAGVGLGPLIFAGGGLVVLGIVAAVAWLARRP